MADDYKPRHAAPEPQPEAAAPSLADEFDSDEVWAQRRVNLDDAIYHADADSVRSLFEKIKLDRDNLREALVAERERHAEDARIAAIVRMYADGEEHITVQVVARYMLALAAEAAAREAGE